MIKNSELISKALRIAALYHKGQTRKKKETPYIIHPVEVAMILQEAGMNDYLVAAGLLHDTLEDTDMTVSELKKEFDDKLVDLVIAASEKLDNRDDTPWHKRKKHTIDYLKTARKEIQIIACADKLSNVKSMARDYEDIGDELWERFNASYKKQKWYYCNLIDSLKNLEGNEIYDEFKRVVKELFEIV